MSSGLPARRASYPIEVIAAIDAHRRAQARVFPVLVNGAELPRREWLPEPMADLVLFQATPALHFDVRDYLAAAAAIHDFLSRQLRELHQAGLVDAPRIAPFARERVPNPHDIARFELPEPLRLLRPEHPFKGLQYFHREDASIFFGRRREITPRKCGPLTPVRRCMCARRRTNVSHT